MKRVTGVVVLATLAVVGVGCTTYYKVSEPGSDKSYYTTNLKQARDGTVTLKDASSGAKVTLESSEVLKISESEYKAAVKKK